MHFYVNTKAVFSEYKRDDVIVNENDEQCSQGNNIAYTSRSSDFQKLTHRKEIFHRI